MDYCEINRQREPAQVFNNYCESGPARGHCSCVAMASVAPVEYLDPSLPPLSSSPAPECSLSMFVAQGAGHGGAAGRESYRWPPPPRPARHRRLLVLLAPKYLGAAVRVRGWDSRRRRQYGHRVWVARARYKHLEYI